MVARLTTLLGSGVVIAVAVAGAAAEHIEFGGVTVGTLGLVGVVVAGLAAGAVQSSLGFGAAFVLAPTLALIAPELLPGAIIVAIIPLSATMVVQRRRGVDLAAVGRVTAGRLPGIVAGGALAGALSERALTIAIAVVLLAAVGSVLGGRELAVTHTREVVAGAVSGLTGTTAALGGPPLALLYRGSVGQRLRGTLAGIWLVGSVPVLASLAAFGSLTGTQVRAGAALGVIVMVGLVAATPLVARMSDATLRSAVLWWAAIGAIVALGRALLGG
jgi:uncharacterized membrane protein YfcA